MEKEVGEKKRILIVDDEFDLVVLLQSLLTASGYEVLYASDGLEGLEKAREEHPDFIFLDIMMPKLDGYRVCRLLKFDDRYRSIPIVLFTARSQDRDKKLAEEVGADGYIMKPFDHKEILAVIQKHHA